MLNWIANKLTQGFNFVGEKLSQGYNYVRNSLRVLLDKPPDIETPIVWGQFLYGCIINSTYSGGLPKLKSLDLAACTVPWDAN